MAEFTKERLTQIVRAIDSEAYDEAEIMGWFNSDDIMAMARQLLAGMEQEPVYQACKEAGVWVDVEPDEVFALRANGEQVRSLYAAPQLPQPAVADESGLLPCPCCGGKASFDYDDENLNWITCDVCSISTDTVYHTDVDARDALREVWNRRAAMLQGAEPVSQAYTLRDGIAAIRSLGPIDAGKIQAERDALNEPTCWCLACRPVTMNDPRFVVCPECGNKRCPHANDHRNACTGSNEPGQEGSAYPAAPQQY